MAEKRLMADERRGGSADADERSGTEAAVHPPIRPSATVLHLPRLAGWYLIRLYQVTLSPVLPPSCRFYPSCSTYALGAVAKYGLLKGSYLAARRLMRCHPFHPGGVDPVP